MSQIMKLNAGDRDAYTTYAAVGLALTRWEQIEQAWAILYSVLVGKPRDIPTIQTFGDKYSGIGSRLDANKSAAQEFFVKVCDQEAEAKFFKALGLVEDCSKVRNHIAHGLVHRVIYQDLVHDVIRGIYRNTEELYVLRAPLHNHFRLRQLSAGYGSEEINDHANWFANVEQTVWDLIELFESYNAT